MTTDVGELVKTDIAEIIDPEVVRKILSSPPFLQVDGLFNIRDISTGAASGLRQDFCYRSGSLEMITEQGKQHLQRLGIETVIDLRSAREISAFPDPIIEGIELVTAEIDTDPLQAVKFESLTEMYMSLLETHKEIWKKILRHVRDFPDKKLLIHCTAGKDRTGVATALLLGLSRSPPSYISHDYALSRIGMEPVRDFLLGKIPGSTTADFKSKRLQTLLGMGPDIMEAFLTEIQIRFGSVEGYVVEVLGFERADVDRIQANLRSR